jgi:hypothetical protein
MSHRIEIANDFSRYPCGRYRDDGEFSAERFRDDLIVPALRAHGAVTVNLDGTLGLAASFLEEAFGGLTRLPEMAAVDLPRAVTIETTNDTVAEIVRSLLRGRLR